MLRNLLPGLLLITSFMGCSGRREFRDGQWRGVLERQDGNNIVFNFEVRDSGGRKVLYIRNAGERLLVDSISTEKDSVIIKMPFFESQLRGVLTSDGNLEGIWRIHLADSWRPMPFKAIYGEGYRFKGADSAGGQAAVDGRWAAVFRSPDGKDTTFRVGEFRQAGAAVTGTFLDAGGDLRYLEGIVDGDSLKLSTFDGNHNYYFSARVAGDSLVGGKMYGGPVNYENWTAVRDSSAHLQDEFAITKWNKDIPFNFSFRDLDGHPVSFTDSMFRGKVVLVQIMGSWCPNCMDETRFLSQFYDECRSKGMQVVSLAYERSTDFARSQRSVRTFQQRFDVKYPMLITGVAVTDPQKTSKTLPMLDEIKDFPTTIFVGKDGKIARIHTGFSGPGTGSHYDEQKKEFRDIVDSLLAR